LLAKFPVTEVFNNFNKSCLGILLASEWHEGAEKIAKILRCIDKGVRCDSIGRAETEEELYKMVMKHPSEAHDMKEIPTELWVKAKTLIKDEYQ